MVRTRERRIFLADDLSDIALAVTVEPQVIGAILYGTLLFGTCVLGPQLDRTASYTKKLSEIGDAFRNRKMRLHSPSFARFLLLFRDAQLLAMDGIGLD